MEEEVQMTKDGKKKSTLLRKRTSSRNKLRLCVSTLLLRIYAGK
jgi:hypothetical protein